MMKKILFIKLYRKLSVRLFENEQQINQKRNEIKCRDAISKTVLSSSFCFCAAVMFPARWVCLCVTHATQICCFGRCAYQKRRYITYTLLKWAQHECACVRAYNTPSGMCKLEPSFYIAIALTISVAIAFAGAMTVSVMLLNFTCTIKTHAICFILQFYIVPQWYRHFAIPACVN